MLTWRCTKPCARCAYPGQCEFLLREIERTVRRLNEVAEMSERRMPECELVLDCCTFWPRTRASS